jgi:hypothetical protein
MTVLEIIQRFCRRTGVPRPVTVFGSTNAQILQALALLDEEGNSLAQRGPWRQLVWEALHTTVADQSQGSIDTIATNGFKYLLWNTLWDRTEQLPLLGPADAADWQFFKAINVTGPRYSFRLIQNTFQSIPAPPVDHIWAFEYVSKNWLVQADGVTYLDYAEDDTDETLLPGELLLLGLRWRWKKEKGLEYAEDFNTYERQVVNYLGRHKPMPTLRMDDRTNSGPKPGIWVPYGSWDV